MSTLLLYVLLTPALYHLGAKATITRWLWERYPDSVDHFMSCPACSGTWYGFMVGAFGQHVLGLRFLGLDRWWSFVVVGLCSLTWTPIAAALHERCILLITDPSYTATAAPGSSTPRLVR